LCGAAEEPDDALDRLIMREVGKIGIDREVRFIEDAAKARVRLVSTITVLAIRTQHAPADTGIIGTGSSEALAEVVLERTLNLSLVLIQP